MTGVAGITGGYGGSGYGNAGQQLRGAEATLAANLNGLAAGFLRGQAGFWGAAATAAPAASSSFSWPKSGGRMRKLLIGLNVALVNPMTFTVYVDGAASALLKVVPNGTTNPQEADIIVDLPVKAVPYQISVGFAGTAGETAFVTARVWGDERAAE